MTGAIISWFLIPDKDRDLENEDVLFREYLAQHGYAGVFGDVSKENDTTAALDH
jgi:hypothetical protein